MDYLPGNFSSYYGGVVGGVVDVKSRNPRTDGFHGVLEVNAYNANVVLDTPITHTLSIAAAYRRSYIDLVLPLFLKDDSPSFTVAPRYDDAQLKLTWKPNGKNTFQFLGLHSQDALQLITKTSVAGDPTLGRDFKNETGFNEARLRHTFVDDAWRVDTVAGFDRTEVDLNIGGERGLTLGASTWALRSTAELRLADWVTPAVGVDWTYTRGTFRAALGRAPREGEPAYFGPTRQILYADSPFWQSQLGLWAELRLRPLPAALIIPGVRMDLVSIRLQHTPLLTGSSTGRALVRSAGGDPEDGVGAYHAPPSLQAGEVDATFGNPDLGQPLRAADERGRGVEHPPGPAPERRGFLQPALGHTGQHQRS